MRRPALFLLAFIGIMPAARAEEFPRNVQIQVEIRSATLMRQGGYESTRQSSQTQFMVVTEGSEGRLFIGKQTPYVQWYREYLEKEGYLTAQVVFRDVGSSLIVRPRIVGNLIEITLTPEVSYETADGSGSIAVTRLATTVMVPNGQPTEIGGGITRTSDFGEHFYRGESGQAVQIVLTPRIL